LLNLLIFIMFYSSFVFVDTNVTPKYYKRISMSKLSFLNFLKSYFQKTLFHKTIQEPVNQSVPFWEKSYDKGVVAEFRVPDQTLLNYLEQAVEESGSKFFINYFNRKINYSDFHSCVKKCASGLEFQGIRKGDRVALILPNMPQFLIAYWAILTIGAIAVLVNPVLSAREIKQQIKIVDAKMIFILDRLLGHLFVEKEDLGDRILVTASIESFLPPVKRLAFHITKPSTWPTIGKSTPSKGIPFQELLHRNQEHIYPSISPDDTAVLLFTGGVTGSPKATVLTHRNLVANALQGAEWMKNILTKNEVMLGALPFVHSYGMSACHHLALVIHATLVLEPRFNVRKVIKDVKSLNVTIFPGVPTMFQAFMDKFEGDPKTCLKFCISGGAPLPRKLQAAFKTKFNHPIAQGYGLSEASPITHCNPIAGENKPESIGLPWPGTAAKIIHTKTGQERPAFKKGELWIKGPQVMKEYWQNPKETRKILKDGWLATGDIAYYDEYGYFYIIDRKKQLIFSGGSNIYPSEVETVLLEHPLIDEAAVVGAQDDFLGQVVKAVIVTNENRDVSLEELSLFCEDKLAKYKIPRQLEKRQQLPKNFLGKVVKRNL
jgi:long-chain acyl-CoA synthetase